MSFDLFGWMSNSFILMFVAVVTGLLFGKIKFGKFSFGVSGALFTGIAVGWFIEKMSLDVISKANASEKMISQANALINRGVIEKGFFLLFLILFVASVGLLAAKDMKAVLKKYGVKFVVLGIVITFVGASATYLMTFVPSSSTNYEIAGVYTGALTSSPGLAAAIETGSDNVKNKLDNWEKITDERKEQMLYIIGDDRKASEVIKLTEEEYKVMFEKSVAGIGGGYAIAYPFGVIIVIFATNFFPRIFKINVDDELEQFHREMDEARQATGQKEIKEVDFDLIAFIVACIFGYSIGKIVISLGSFGSLSLGATGGVLIGSLILGYIGKIGFLNFRMNNKILSVIRQFSLAFFLAIVGLRYGYGVVNSVSTGGAYLALVSIVVGVTAMMVGFLLGRYVFKINWILLVGAICGGMTSTPGLGSAIDAVGSDDPAAGYGATYPFALLGMVIFTIVLYNLPM